MNTNQIGGVNAFSRYENGTTKPPLALIKLLKVLDRHPDLLDAIKAAYMQGVTAKRAGPFQLGDTARLFRASPTVAHFISARQQTAPSYMHSGLLEH